VGILNLFLTPRLLSLTYSISNWQTQSFSDPNFGQKMAGLRMGPWFQIKAAIFDYLLLLFAFGLRTVRPIF
jgi:hypothetical protein